MEQKLPDLSAPVVGFRHTWAYSPISIGSVIKDLAEKKHITPVELAKRVGVEHGNIHRLFKSRKMAIRMLFKMSEALEENLLLLYHPNVKPLPDLHKLENEQLKAENAQLKEQLLEMEAIAEENIKLKAKLEILTEVMKAK